MKTLEVNEKSQRSQGGSLTKLLISQLFITLKYQIGYQSNATTYYFYLIGIYEKKLISIFMNFNESIRKEEIS